jgi:uncharacterized protein YcaQ
MARTSWPRGFDGFMRWRMAKHYARRIQQEAADAAKMADLDRRIAEAARELQKRGAVFFAGEPV